MKKNKVTEDEDIIKIKQNSEKGKDNFVYCLTDEYMKSKKFLDIEYDIKKKINFQNFENLKELKVKDILQ